MSSTLYKWRKWDPSNDVTARGHTVTADSELKHQALLFSNVANLFSHLGVSETHWETGLDTETSLTPRFQEGLNDSPLASTAMVTRCLNSALSLHLLLFCPSHIFNSPSQPFPLCYTGDNVSVNVFPSSQDSAPVRLEEHLTCFETPAQLISFGQICSLWWFTVVMEMGHLRTCETLVWRGEKNHLNKQKWSKEE